MELGDVVVVGKMRSGVATLAITDDEAEEPDLPYVVGGGLLRLRDLLIREGIICGEGGNLWAEDLREPKNLII